MARDLPPAATLGAYGAGLALVFVAALGIGKAVGPVGTTADEPRPGTHSTGPGEPHEGVGDGTHTPSTSGQAR